MPTANIASKFPWEPTLFCVAVVGITILGVYTAIHDDSVRRKAKRARHSLGFVRLAPRQAEKAQRLCQEAQREHGEDLLATCRKLRETLSQFGHEEPEARIRARACGCPVMR